MYLVFIELYLFLALLAGFFGRKTKLGFFRSTALAIIFSPLVAGLILLLFFPVKLSALPEKYRKRFQQ